jgi:cytochrome c-type biogenesis protein CcmH/NrfG
LNQILAGDSDDLETRAALGRVLLSDGRVGDAAREYASMLDALGRRGWIEGEEKSQ